METADRKYVFKPIEALSAQDKAYLAALPLPPIARDRLRWGVTELAKQIPSQPVNGFSGRVIAFNGRQFLVAVRNDRISDTRHPPSMLDEASLQKLMELYADELSPEERILAAAATHEALWTADPATAANVLPKGQFDDLLPAGALPIAYDGFWLAYKDPPTADGLPGALRTMRVSEADAKAMKLRDFLLEKFVNEARYIPGDVDQSLIRALARKERLTSASVGEKHVFKGASNRSGNPIEGRWIYRDETGSVILLADGTVEVVAGTDEDAKWYESIGAGTMAGTTAYDDLPEVYPWREWSSLPENARSARLVSRTGDSAFVQARDGNYLRFDRKNLSAEDEAYVETAELHPVDSRPVRITPLPSAQAWENQPIGMVDVRPVMFNGRAAICATLQNSIHVHPILSAAVDLRSRKIFLGRCALMMDAEDWIRAAGVTRQAIWQERDGTPLQVGDSFAVAFDGESVLLERDADRSDGDDDSDQIERLTGYRIVAVAASESDADRRLFETLQTRSDQESRPLETAELLAKKAFASKGRGEFATLGERRLWTGRFVRSVGPMEGRLLSRNDRTCAVLLEDGTLDVLLGLSEEDAAYLNAVEGFLSPRAPVREMIVYHASDLDAIGKETGRQTVRAWASPPLDGRRAEAIAWDAKRLFLRDVANGSFSMLPLTNLLPEDRAWLDARPRPQFEAAMERWTPSGDAKEYPSCPTQPFDGAPIAFNGRAALFLLPGDVLAELWYDFAALSPESQRKILERFDDQVDDRAKFLAAWRMRQAIWVEEPGKPYETFKAIPGIGFIPDLDRAVAYDGRTLVSLWRRPPGVEGRMTRPNYSAVQLGPEGGIFNLLEPQLRDRFVAGSRPLPECDVPQLLAAYERAGRREPPKFGERRLWQKGTLSDPTPKWGRLVQAISTACVVLDDENRVDVVAGLTEEDCVYLNSVEGFRPSGATEEENAPAYVIDFGESMLARLDRIVNGPVDEKFLRDLDDVLAYLRRSGPYDGQSSSNLIDAMNNLAIRLRKADAQVREEEIKRIKAAIASGEISQVAGEAKLKAVENEPLDPSDRTNEMERAIAKWKQTLPDSSFPWTIEAAALYAIAWNARGDGFAGDVTEEGRRVHEQLIPRADAAIEEAAKRSPNDYYLRAMQMQIGRSAGYDLEKLREVFYAGLAGDRNFDPLVGEMVFTLLPQWYGSPGDVGAFAAEMMDYYGDAEGTVALNFIIGKQAAANGTRLLQGEFPPETLARGARYLASRPKFDASEHVRAEVFAFLGGDFALAWELKRRTLFSKDPEVKRRRDIDWSNDRAIRDFYAKLDGPPDVRRARRVDFERRDSAPPSMDFVASGRIALIDSGDSSVQAFDVAAMAPSSSFVVPDVLDPVRFLASASDRVLGAVGTDPSGVRRIMCFDAAGEQEPVVMRETEPFPSMVAMSPSGDVIAAARDNPEGAITFWDGATGNVQGTVTAPFPARQLLFSPGGERLAVWDGEKNLVFVDAATRELGQPIELPAPGHFPQFVRDGRLAFLARSGTAAEPRWTAVVVDPERARAEELSQSWPSKLPSFGDAVFDDELDHAFVIAHPDNPEPDDGVHVIDLKTGAAVTKLDGHFDSVLQLKYRGDAQRLYSLGRDRHLMEWDVSPTGMKAASENDRKP